MIAPQENINICFVGGVSTGKSTMLNAIFCEKLTQCKIKRTTMVPTVYVENERMTVNPFEKEDKIDNIFRTIEEKNTEIIAKTEKGEPFLINDCTELVFNVGKLDINILSESYVNVYDIPGLNDARTSKTYYQYLETNFHKFNLIILLVDIQSGLNTSDEMDILNFIITNTKKQLGNNRSIFTMVVVNKADDMFEEEEILCLAGEMKEMYDQVRLTVESEFSKENISSNLIGITPLCAIDSYLYRMVQKYGSDVKLTPQEILKIGINQEGKKFARRTALGQEREVRKILQDEEFVKLMIKLSGFSNFEYILHEFLSQNDYGKVLRIENILYDLRKLPKLSDLEKNKTKWFDMDVFPKTVKQFKDAYDQIKCIDENAFNEKIISLVEEIKTILMGKVLNWQGTKEDLLVAYDNFEDVIMIRYFIGYHSDEYPEYLTKKLINDILKQAGTKKMGLDEIVNIFLLLDQIDKLTNSEIVNELLDKFTNNIYKNKAIVLMQDTEIKLLLQYMDEIKKNVKISKFLRFCILNQLECTIYNVETMQKKLMVYKYYNEIPIQLFINNKVGPNNERLFKAYVDGLQEQDFKDPNMKLDMYYLSYERMVFESFNLGI
jgi:GTP-binding protein EngB required for normal cell division